MSPITLLALALAAGPVKPAGSPDPATLAITSDQHARARALVRQLGHEAFRDRDRAFHDLREMGRLALGTLTSAVETEADPEIRFRCELLLPDAAADDFNSRLAVFLADKDGKHEHELPGWAKFRELTGNDPLGRELFAAVLQDADNREVIAGMAVDRKELARRVQLRRQDLYAKMYQRVVNGVVTSQYQPTLLDAATLLFCETVLGDKDAPAVAVRGNIALYSLLFRLNAKTPIALDRFGPPVRALTVAWCESRETAAGLSQAMNVAAQLNMPEGKKCAAKLLGMGAKEGVSPYLRASAAAMIARLGKKEDAKLLVPLLTDDTTVRPAAGTNAEIQVRDTALAMAVHMTGRELKDFGFESRAPLGTTTLSYYYQWFPSDDDRKKAFEKWAKLEPTLAPEVKKSEPKTDEPKPEEKK